ncbi:MAG: glycosyl hydrolase [Bacteroides sp.]|nr:glycosyl hydrolase [Bacteroides sp.]
MTKLIYLIVAGCSLCTAVNAQSTKKGSLPEWQKKYSNPKEIRTMFTNPPMFYAPHTFWFWDDAIKDEQSAAVMAEEMAKQRLNPGYAHPRSGFDGSVAALPVEQYLAKPWFNSFGNTLQKTKELGMSFSYCDDYNWPSGQAAGKVLELSPELEAQYLAWQRYEVTAKKTVRYESIDFAVAGKKVNGQIDAATLQVIGKGKNISWTAPEGDWVVYTYEVKHHPGIDGGRVNYLDPKLMEVFIPLVHEKYDAQFGKEMGKTMPGVFVDNEGDYGWQMAWSEHFAQQYENKKKRDIRLWLPLLTEEDKDGIYAKARCDWFDVVSDVYTECYFKPLVTWLQERGMYYISNLWEESLLAQTVAVGDLMKTTRAVTMPGNDCLVMKSQEVHDFKEVQSVAEFEDRPFMSEIMGVAGWIQSPEMMKMTINSVTSFGVSHVVPHGIYMNRKLESIPFPTDWYSDNPYWDYMHLWTDFARRAAFITRQSRLVADALLINPLESVWAFSECYFKENAWGQEERWDKRAVEANRTFSEAMQQMNVNNIDFLIGDNYYLEKGEIGESNGKTKITINKHDFYALVLPPVYVMSRSAFHKIAEFAKKGGTVILLGELPKGSPEHGMNDEVIIEESNSLRKMPNVIDLATQKEKQKELIVVLNEKVKPQMRFENAGRLYTAHRTMGNTHLYWLANNTDTVRNFTAWLRDGEGAAEIWNCENGQMQVIPSGKEKGYNKVALTLNPYEGYWLAFNPQAKNAKSMERKNMAFKEKVLEGKWKLSYPERDTVCKTTAKVFYANDERIDESKLKLHYDQSDWKYYAWRENLSSKHAYWRMNIPVGTKSIVLPAQMLGKDIWIDGKKQKLSDTLVRLSSDASLLAFVLNSDEQKNPIVPFKFLVDSGEVDDLQSWYAFGLQQYTGYVDCETTITIDKPSQGILIDLGKVRSMAEIFVNDQSVGARLWPPFVFDISDKLKAGENKIKIRVGNLIINEIWMKDDMQKLRMWGWQGVPNLNLYDSGISGPIKLKLPAGAE